MDAKYINDKWNKKKILKSAAEHRTSMDDDWGFGQINIDKILAMVNVGKEFDLEFTFAKTVTALDDECYRYRTIMAEDNSLFVFPSKNFDMSNFWERVNNELANKKGDNE